MKKSVTARIPMELYDKCNQQYENMTDAVIAGLKLLCNQNEIICKTDVITIEKHGQCIKEKDVKINELQNYNKNLTRELENLKTKEPENKGILQLHEAKIKDLEEKLKAAPNPVELADIRARSEELEKHNSTLKGELEKAHQDKDNIQSLYDNYMRQMQTLIKQKAIEAPGEKKKPRWKFW